MKSLLTSKRSKAILSISVIAIGIRTISKKGFTLPKRLLFKSDLGINLVSTNKNTLYIY